MNKIIKEYKKIKRSMTEIIISVKHDRFAKNKHMKKFVLLLLGITLMAQTYAQSTISTCADHNETSAVSLSWTIGEAVIETVSDGTNTLTQGFHQSKLIITAIETQPEAETIACEGEADIVLSVIASGYGTITYQWYNSGGEISGEKAAILSIETLPANSDNYYCIVSSELGNDVQSDYAKILINSHTSGEGNVSSCVSYTWDANGNTYNSSGTYTATLTNANGCDSIATLYLTINPVYNTSDAQSICEGDTYVFGTQELTEANAYTETFSSISGCDSIVTLTLNVNPTFAETDEATICNGDSYIFGTQSLSVEGYYVETFQSVNGCDSVVTLTLSINSIYNETVSAAICEGDEFIFGTQTLIEAGEYNETFASVTGCDSIVSLTLNVNPTFAETASAAICIGDSYIFGTQSLSVEGDYVETFQSVNGCDSVVTLTLSINSIYNETVSAAICEGDE
ncbi:MAG: hypothetical protein JEZ09_19565, partial [Salinivirgaceae bacterium]|nr:hypothetical protein [Salinivirgaceae bacterium]